MKAEGIDESAQNEVKVFCETYGWQKNNGASPLYSSDGSTSIDRVYNQKPKGIHYLSTSLNEYNTLPKYGLKQEGAAHKAVKVGEPFDNIRYYNQ